MNENDILAETVIGSYTISTYDDGLLWQTDVTRKAVPPDDQIWTMGRCFSEEEAADLHKKTVSEIIRGMVPGGGA